MRAETSQTDLLMVCHYDVTNEENKDFLWGFLRDPGKCNDVMKPYKYSLIKLRIGPSIISSNVSFPYFRVNFNYPKPMSRGNPFLFGSLRFFCTLCKVCSIVFWCYSESFNLN